MSELVSTTGFAGVACGPAPWVLPLWAGDAWTLPFWVVVGALPLWTGDAWALPLWVVVWVLPLWPDDACPSLLWAGAWALLPAADGAWALPLWADSWASQLWAAITPQRNTPSTEVNRRPPTRFRRDLESKLPWLSNTTSFIL